MTFTVSRPIFTVCIPFYKDKTYLLEALLSVAKQKVPSWRCIVLDDAGPEEDTDQLVASLQDERFSYYRNDKNLGLAGNWNKCFQISNTELIVLLHADDRLDASYLEKILEICDEHPNSIAYYCRTRIINQKGVVAFSFPDLFKKFLMPSLKKITILEGEKGLTSLMHGNFVFCPTLCYRKSLVNINPFSSDWKMVLDLEWLAKALLNKHQIVGSPSIAYEYRRHPQNQSSLLTKSFLRFSEEFLIHRQIAKSCRDIGWTRASNAATLMVSVRLHIAYKIAELILKLRIKDILALIKTVKNS